MRRTAIRGCRASARVAGRRADHIDGNDQIDAIELVEGNRIDDATVDHHTAADADRLEQEGDGGGGGERRQKPSLGEHGCAAGIIVGRHGAKRNPERGEVLGDACRQERGKRALEVILTEAEGDLAEPPWPELPERARNSERLRNRPSVCSRIAAPLMPEA